MRRRIVWIIIGVPLALIVIGAGAALSMPAVRHVITGFMNLPDRLPALTDNPLVHYESGAEDFARDVADLLPAAIARVEAVHGRPFAHPVTVGAYATPEAFAAANGLGSNVPVGVTFAGRVNLSPKLFYPQHWRLRAILTHEMSHAHLVGYIGGASYFRLPPWFKEGLAVMISEGGGAELVKEDEAWAAIQRGEQIAIDDPSSPQTTIDIRLRARRRRSKTPPGIRSCWPIGKPACSSNTFGSRIESAFDRMMGAILDGRSLADAVDAGYHDDVRALWRKFVSSSADKK